tara:strand:+ start:3304 stop:3816 length:513 start_codon:yes stop_codon:yes gene_type:complete
MNATNILNDILQKLSVLTKEDEVSQELSVNEVQEETIEAVSEATEEVKENAAELSDVEATTKVEAEEEYEAEEGKSLNEGYVSDERYAADMEALKAEISAIKSMVQVEMSSMEKEKQTLSEQVKELSKEAAAEPIKHNPEAKTEKKMNFSYGQNKPLSTLDRVMAKISNK